MQRHQLEHIVRAAAGITGAPEFVIVGSQSILGQFPEAPAELLASMEADIFSLRSPEDADLVDGCIGEGSPFHQTFGYYAHGVGHDTAVLPDGWAGRLVPVRNANTGMGTGLCLEVHDLAASKLVAGREKDMDFVAGLFRHGMLSADILRSRVLATRLTPNLRTLCEGRIQRLSGA
jgi:hypothetical protein